MDRFEKLRGMDAFTEDMFNRIIAFQEKTHPAWDYEKPYSERIKGLPLHFLVFSNADRDPAIYAHTVAPYFPLRKEMKTIADYAKLVSEATPVLCDLYCGNGFIGSLIGREGVKVVGVHPPDARPNQISTFFDPSCFERKTIAVEAIDFAFDVALSSWMPPGVNLTVEMLRYRPKLLVFIYTNHVDPQTRERQTGTDDAFSGLPDNYKLIDSWSVTRPKNLFHEIWPDLTPNIEETRYVSIYADSPYHGIYLAESATADPPYDWENELEMALLALEAKAHLRLRGSAM